VLVSEEHRELLAAVDRLPRRQREALVLRYWLELSEREIADAMGVSPGSVKTHASRGLAALGRALKEEDR
jgi:RNA polymerase sigma factor (sigma-70 family)